MQWYGVCVMEEVALALVRFLNVNGILSERDGCLVWYKAREIECELVCRFLERR